MSERRECEFFLVRYVPDPVRDEFVHVGVILRGAGSGSTRPAGGGQQVALRFTSDWRRVRCLDPDADTEMLEGLESELRRRFAGEPDGNLMHVLEDSFSNCVQVTRAKAFLVESMESGVEELMRLYVEPQRRERVSKLAGRAAIQSAMRGEFERAGVWDLLRKRIAASAYTRPGDPLRLDCGYRVGSGFEPAGVIRMFQAVTLESSSGVGLEMAKILAFSEASLRAGVRRVEGAELELTAVVEPLRQGSATPASKDRSPGAPAGVRDQGSGGRGQAADREQGTDEESERLAAYRFSVDTMEEHRIRVVTTADLGRVAETARREMAV